MTNFKQVLINQRNEQKATNKTNFETEQEFKNWKNDVEALRIVTSEYACINLINGNDEEITKIKDAFFEAYRKVLSYFTNKALGEKLKPKAQDLNSIVAFVGGYRRNRGADGKEFLPASTMTFRKSLEIFISDRLTGAKVKTAEDIEKARAEARKIKKITSKTEKEKAIKEVSEKVEKANKAAEKASSKAQQSSVA